MFIIEMHDTIHDMNSLLPGDIVKFDPKRYLHSSFRDGLGLIVCIDNTTGKFNVLWPDSSRTDCYDFELIKQDRANEAVLFEVIKRLLSVV